MSGIVVGVDAGGSGVVAAVERDGAVATFARDEAANPNSVGADAAAQAIASVVREALAGQSLDALFVAAAGAGRSATREALTVALQAAFPQTTRIVVEDDARVALRSAVAEGPGAVVIAGTGAVAYAENGPASVRAGGDGYLLGDEGSGYAIGRAAVAHYARTFDGRARADETSAHVAAALGAGDRDALLGIVYSGDVPVARIAALAPGVIALADSGERTSTKIVQTAATDLATLVRHVIRASGLAEASPLVGLSGGLLRENSLLSYLLETRIVNETSGAAIVRSREEPAVAALRLARALG